VTGNPADRERALHKLGEDALTCRAWGHAWIVSLFWGAMVDGAVHVGFRTEMRTCERCGTSVETIFDGQLGLLEARWSYGPNYLLPAGLAEGQTYRSEARGELWDRVPREVTA
jgi:hypothetical protein